MEYISKKVAAHGQFVLVYLPKYSLSLKKRSSDFLKGTRKI